MSDRNLGIYIDQVSGRQYTVIKQSQKSFHSPLSSRSNVVRTGNDDYKTSCGIELMPLDTELKRFELIDIDGIIVKQE